MYGERAYAGGDGRRIYAFDGANWTLVCENLPTDPYAIYAASHQSIYIGDFNGGIHHFDGSIWQPMESGVEGVASFYGAWGGSEDDVYMYGSEGTVVHFDGSGWETMDTGTNSIAFYDMWGTSATSLWLVGSGGSIYTGDGSSWSPLDQSVEGGSITAVWADGPDNVFASSESTILHYDGEQWTGQAVPEPVRDLVALAEV